MKMNLKIISVFLIFVLMLTGCSKNQDGPQNGASSDEILISVADLGDDSSSFGEAIEDIGTYDGYFEEDIVDLQINCISGTKDCYSIEDNVVKFSSVGEDSVYSISGKLSGSIIIDTGDGYKFDLELQGLSVVSTSINPITVLSGDEASITSKSGYKNYIYDMRDAIDDAEEALYSGAIHSNVDLEICGKGELTVLSENNNGIHSKDDLRIKNLSLTVVCMDNALKGNDSVEIENGTYTLIAAKGDGIKTTKSDISKKGNQRGSVSINNANLSIYAACDGIDAAYNVSIDGDSTQLNIYTDKYSNYSEEVTAVSASDYYIRFTSDRYAYSVKYYNSDDDYTWVDAKYHSKVSGTRSTYYYYSFPEMSGYQKIQLFIYSTEMDQGQEDEYLVCSDYMTLNESYDTFALTSRGDSLSYTWTNYTTTVNEGGFGGPGGMGGHGGMGGPGGMNDGNSDKGSYSTKGIKAENEILILAGTLNIKAYDDAIHANNDGELENGGAPLGNVTVSGGSLTLYSNDDGIHADGVVSISAGTICVTNSYEGIEGSSVQISGGYISVISSDDGINSTGSTGIGVSISAGTIYIYCSGDGIDSNSRESYGGIVFSGGNTVVISTSGGDSALDTEQGYTYEGGRVVAVMPRGGMSNEAMHCRDFSSIGCSKSMTLSSGSYLVTEIGETMATVRMPCDISGLIIILGDKSASISNETSSDVSLDANGVCWQ